MAVQDHVIGRFLRLLKKDKVSSLSVENSERSSKNSKSLTPKLVHDRPLSIQERYQLIDQEAPVDQLFQGLEEILFNISDRLSMAARKGMAGGKLVFREGGKTQDGRHYVYLKPTNDYGWLFERSGMGWRVSRAEKIASHDMLLRSHNEPWDLVTVWKDPKGESGVRIRSRRFSTELISFQQYEKRLLEALEPNLLLNDQGF